MLDIVRRGAGARGRWRPTAGWVKSGLRIVALAVSATLCPAIAGAQAWVPTDIGAAAGVISSDATAVSDGGPGRGLLFHRGGPDARVLVDGNVGFVDLGTLGGSYRPSATG